MVYHAAVELYTKILLMDDMSKYKAQLSEIEQQVQELLQRSAFFLQTYRAIDALNVLREALGLVERNTVMWQLKAGVYRNLGEAYVQMNKFDEGIASFKQSYEILEDGNDKAACASMLAGYYLRDGKKGLALEYASKALDTATAPELMSEPYHIQGGVAVVEGDFPKAIELLNKAASYAEKSHGITDLAMIIMDISAIYMKMGLNETALSEIYRAERYVKECRNLDLYRQCAIRRAKILYMMGKDEEAKRLVMAIDEQNNH